MLCRLVAIPSPTGQEEAAASYLVEAMRALGLKAGLDAAGNPVGIAGRGDREVLLVGHVDTVPGDIPVRLEAGVLHGRGAVDAKGALAAFVAAASRFVDSPELRVVVVGAVGEEGDSRGARHLVDSGAYDPAAIVVGEPSGTDGITIGYRGAVRLLYRVETEVAHAGAAHTSAPDAAIDFVNRLRQALDASSTPRFDAAGVTVKRLETRTDGLTTSCEALVDVRTPPGVLPDAVREAAEKCAAVGRAVVLDAEEPVLAGKNNALVRAFLAALRAEGLAPRFVKKTGTSDMNLLARAFPGLPILAYGPGDSRLDHTPREAVSTEDYLRSIRVVEGVLRRLAKPATGEGNRPGALR